MSDLVLKFMKEAGAAVLSAAVIHGAQCQRITDAVPGARPVAENTLEI